MESECTNNDVEYEDLIQRIWKAIDLKVKSIEVFGDSRLVIKHVRNSTFCTFYHFNNYQREVWSLINKIDSFDIKSFPHTEYSENTMLIDEASNLNLDDSFIDMKFDIETCGPLIPNTNWRNSSDDQPKYFQGINI